MKIKITAVLLSVGLFLAACTGGQQRTAPAQTREEQHGEQSLGPVPSAAAPGVPPGGALAGADKILAQAKVSIAAHGLSGSEPGYKEFRIETPKLVFTCQYSPGGTGQEVPLLACKFGEFVNTMTGHALFWHDGTEWQAQVYPEAPPDMVQKRHSFFRALGGNCPIGCGSEFRTLRQSGTELLVVVDLSGVSSRSNQEVHLLKRDGRQWRVLWVPDPHDLRFADAPPVSRHPKITLAAQGVGQFVVSYDDGSSDTWVRQGSQFVPRSQSTHETAGFLTIQTQPEMQPAWTPPDVPLTADLPTFAAVVNHPAWAPGLPGPTEPSPDPESTLAKLAANLERTGSPEVPAGVAAVYVGALEGGYHVYHLGHSGRDPGGNRVYMLSRAEKGWVATPICTGANRWIWAGTRQQTQQPVVICATSEGSGSVMAVAVYKAGQEVFRAEGLVGGTLQVEDAASGPPTLTMTSERQWMDHKLDPTVRERFTFRWDAGAYTLASHQRMADAAYHLARFLTFLAANNLAEAAGEMADPPADLTGFLRQQVPSLKAGDEVTWTTEGFYPPRTRDGRIYLHQPRSDGPWFWFSFATDGRIQDVGEQVGAPR